MMHFHTQFGTYANYYKPCQPSKSSIQIFQGVGEVSVAP